MIKIVENAKNFKVLEITSQQCKEKIGGLGICDDCNKDFETAYYVAVLNHCYCQKCYDSWMLRAVNYKEDHYVETKNFDVIRYVLERDENKVPDLFINQIFEDFWTDEGIVGRDKTEVRETYYCITAHFLKFVEKTMAAEGDEKTAKKVMKIKTEIADYFLKDILNTIQKN